MRLVPKTSLVVDRSALDRPRNLVVGMDGLLAVAAGDALIVRSADLREIARIQLPSTITDVGGADGWWFAVSEGQLRCGRLDQGPLAPLPDPIWGDENDHFTWSDGKLWYISADPLELRAFDPVQARVAHRFPLDPSWETGSFSIWPGPGMVAVEVAMDTKLAVASMAPAPSFRELPNESYVLGFAGSDLVSAADALIVRSMPSGNVVAEWLVDDPPQGLARVKDETLLVGAGGVHRLTGQGLEVVELHAPGEPVVYHAVALNEDVALLLDDGTLLVCAVSESEPS